MTKYEEYKNKIKDVKYIFLSNELDLIDYQYILTLFYESIYVISEDLVYEIKEVLDPIKFEEIPFSEDITNKQTYLYLLWAIKRDINNYNVILDTTKKQIINILTQLNNSLLSQDENIENNQSPSKDKEINNTSCIMDCFNCQSPCGITESIIEKTTNEINNVATSSVSTKEVENFVNSKIPDIKYFNHKYLKEYLLSNHLKKNECARCGLVEWQNSFLQMKIDFIDGNIYNQDLNNIQLLCPNCFSQIGHEND